jgi:hypothetical protein
VVVAAVQVKFTREEEAAVAVISVGTGAWPVDCVVSDGFPEGVVSVRPPVLHPVITDNANSITAMLFSAADNFSITISSGTKQFII